MGGVNRFRRGKWLMYATFEWLLLWMALLVYEIGRVILDKPTMSSKMIGMLGMIWAPIMLALVIATPNGRPNEPTNSDS